MLRHDDDARVTQARAAAREAQVDEAEVRGVAVAVTVAVTFTLAITLTVSCLSGAGGSCTGATLSLQCPLMAML